MRGRILIVEDERLVARELQMRLEDNGFVVTGIVASAEAALVEASAQIPDLVLMDIHISGNRDGIDAAALLQQQFDVPVVFLTAYGDDATVERAKQAGAAGFLLKPPKERDLVVAIEVARHKHELGRQLRAREKWFSTTLKSIGDAVISTDPHGNIAFMNPVAEALTGWRAEDAQGQATAAVVRLVRTEGSEGPIEETLRRRAPVHVDGVLTDQHGVQRAIADSAAPIVDETGALLGGVLVFRDVTEQRALERQLEAAERLASLGTLAAGVAHEINNPLTWVIANLDHVGEALGETSPLYEEIMDARRGAERIRTIVRDLTVFSKRMPERSGCRVSDAVRDAVASTPSPVGIEVAIDAPAYVALDESRLVQVLANLLTNAVHAIADAPPRVHHLAIRTTTTADEVAIAVSDTGVGMSAHTRARAFEPFYTTKAMGRGTGLGLAISHGLITSIGGSIAITDTPGGGTTMTVRLPIVQPVVVAAPVRVAIAGRVRVLAIDDEPLMRRLFQRALKDDDVTAVGVREAMLMLHDGQRFDVILCDLMMSELSGIELYEQLLRFAPDQAERVVFITGGAFSIQSTEFLTNTRCPVFEKPFTPEALRTMVHQRASS